MHILLIGHLTGMDKHSCQEMAFVVHVTMKLIFLDNTHLITKHHTPLS